MKSIVRMTVAAAVLLFSAGSLAAQGPDGQKMTPEQRAERMTRRMTEQLSLSDEQARQIEQILLDRFKEMPQAPRRPAGEPSARPSDRRFGPGAEQRQEMDEQIKSVLTDAQYQKWTEMRRDMKPGATTGVDTNRGKESTADRFAIRSVPVRRPFRTDRFVRPLVRFRIGGAVPLRRGRKTVGIPA